MAILKRLHQIARIELVVVGPISIGPRRVADDGVFIFADLEDVNEVSRVEDSVDVGVSRSGESPLDVVQAEDDVSRTGRADPASPQRGSGWDVQIDGRYAGLLRKPSGIDSVGLL
jgi:hypothetical protein